MERWNGKVAVVTGASKGIGAAIACSLADKGLIVVGLARRADKIKELSKISKGQIHAISCNMTVEQEIKNAFKWVEDKFGGVDLLINNAAVLLPGFLSDGMTDDWKTTLDTNVLAICISIREAMRSMRQRGDNGHIININSICGHKSIGLNRLSLYSISKHAITGLNEIFKYELLELKSNIKISSLSPGLVYTDLITNVSTVLIGKSIGKVSDPVPPGYLRVQDVADAVIAIISMKPHVQVEEMIVQCIGSYLG